MKYRYSICHIDKPDVEFRDEIINREQVLEIVNNYPWADELRRMKSIQEKKICYSPSLDFKNLQDSHSLSLTAEGEPDKVSYSLWYNRPIKRKILFGLLGEKEKLEVIDKWFEK